MKNNISCNIFIGNTTIIAIIFILKCVNKLKISIFKLNVPYAKNSKSLAILQLDKIQASKSQIHFFYEMRLKKNCKDL